MLPARPRLKPLRRVWRDAATLQLGIDTRAAVVVTGLDEQRARLVDRFDGTADLASLRLTAARMGLEPTAVDDLVTLLAGSGVLEEVGEPADPRAAHLRPIDRERLAPDGAAATLARRDGRTGSTILAGRRTAVVTVHGGGRVGSSVAALLAAAGIGTVVVEDAATVRPGDLSPAGLGEPDLGARRQDSVSRRVHDIAPGTRTSLPARSAGRALTVLTADSGWPDARVGNRLVRAGQPHLVAVVRETTGVVGPFVVPGRTACQRCLDLHRTDRDPAWPTIRAQLAGGSRGPDPCDVVLATSVAASAALMVLAYVDDCEAELSLAANGTVEIAQATGEVRRRTWSRHPSCGCAWLPEAQGL